MQKALAGAMSLRYLPSVGYWQAWPVHRFSMQLVCVTMHRESRQSGDELFDVLGRRWAMRIVWEIGDAALTYREISSEILELSTSVLTQRLRELRVAGLVEHTPGAGYRLTPQGRQVRTHLEGLWEWAQQASFVADPHRPPGIR
jgi:DNA-binding HxlR family transcriptional regulator